MKKNRKPILIYLLIIVILGLFIYAVPKVTDIFETTTVLETGTLQVTEETECYFVRTEAVYEAGAAGNAEYRIEEGVHIRTGTVLADFKENAAEGAEVMSPRSKYVDIIENVGDAAVRTVSFESKSSGIVSYCADGYESILTPNTMESFTRDKAMEIDAKPVELGQTTVRSNEPVLKICDNDNWYIMCWVEPASVANYEAGNKITVTLPEGSVDMKIQSITQDGDYWKMILWSNNYYSNFARCRVEEGLLIAKDYTGLITESSNIITQDGKPGVMVLQKTGDYEFVRVKVKASDGEYSALEDVSFTDEEGNLVNTVNVYDEILKNPGKSS